MELRGSCLLVFPLLPMPSFSKAMRMRGRKVARDAAEMPTPTSTVVQIATPTVLSLEMC